LSDGADFKQKLRLGDNFHSSILLLTKATIFDTLASKLSGQGEKMDDNLDDSKESNFIQRMEGLSKQNRSVSHRDFERLIKEGGNLTLQETKQVFYFASEQLAFWEAEWFYSPAHSPNTTAQEEIEGWHLIYKAISNTLVEKVPQIRGELEKLHTRTLLRHSIERTVAYNKTRPLLRISENIFSSLSFALDKLGFQRAAKQLYARSLYPKGTVGRKG
jgi:hypothetical protein